MAKQLARHGVALKVNDWLFAHGGIMPHHGEIIYLGPCDIHFYYTEGSWVLTPGVC
jgi:hypothetical protein